MAGLFMPGEESILYESDLIARFLKTIDEIDCYLDEYDEFYGLAFADPDPIDCLDKLTKFLRDRIDKLMEEDSNRYCRGHRIEAGVIDDCCMTAPVSNIAYIVGKKNPDSDGLPKADAKRIAEAIANIERIQSLHKQTMKIFNNTNQIND